MLLPGVADWRELTSDYLLQLATIIGLYACMETHFIKKNCAACFMIIQSLNSGELYLCDLP